MMSELFKTVSIVLITHVDPILSYLEDWCHFFWKMWWENISKKRPNFSRSWWIWIRYFRRWIHTLWALNPPYFQYCSTPSSLLNLGISGPLLILEVHENSHFSRYSLNYLSDHLSSVLKWKYVSSAF